LCLTRFDLFSSLSLQYERRVSDATHQYIKKRKSDRRDHLLLLLQRQSYRQSLVRLMPHCGLSTHWMWRVHCVTTNSCKYTIHAFSLFSLNNKRRTLYYSVSNKTQKSKTPLSTHISFNSSSSQSHHHFYFTFSWPPP